MQVKFKKLVEAATIPQYQTGGAAAMDLHSAVAVRLHAHTALVVSTGLAVAIPEGFEGQVRPRSGIAAKNGVTVLNSPGTIDSDFRGELKVILINHSPHHYEITVGDRIAQMLICPVVRAELKEVEFLDPTERGAGGLGSTGV